MSTRWLPFLLAAVACGCRSVAVPVERYYRLEPPPVAAPDPQRGGVLRVHDLQLATALDAGCLLRQEGVRLEPRPLSRWVAPLDRLVTDAVVLGLSRARVCELVKGGADPGGETWALRGRIVEFAEAIDDAGAVAAVTLELWLEAGDQLLFHGEFAAREPIVDGADREAAVVAALSRGIGTVVGSVVQRMRGMALFATARQAAEVRPVAAPPR